MGFRLFVDIADLAGGDFSEGGDDFAVFAIDERVDPLIEFTGPSGGDVDQGEAVLAIFQAIFDGDSSHIGGGLVVANPLRVNRNLTLQSVP